MSTTRLSRTESRAAFSLASIFGLRMLGLFMIYPVFATYAEGLRGATPALVGMALGVYGLTQALLQIPFGSLSDRIGRKPVIACGLILFGLGGVVAALSTSIVGMIIGRAIQGGGAVGSAILALNADLTREQTRTQAMAIVGMTIGVAFGVGFVLGPLLDKHVGVAGIFWLTSILAGVGLAVLYVAVPKPRHIAHHADTEVEAGQFKRVLADRILLRLDFGIFAQHAILTAIFLILPGMLESANLSHDWLFYLPILVVAFFAMVPFIIIGEKHHKMKPVFVGAISALGLACVSLALWHHNLWAIGVALFVFFAAFSLLESVLPSLISKAAPIVCKGTAMGVYSSSQFFGIFVGGAFGGWLNGVVDNGSLAVFIFIIAIAVVWLVVAIQSPKPQATSSRLVVLAPHVRAQAGLTRKLQSIDGVIDVAVMANEGVAYLKVNAQRLDTAALSALEANDAD